MSIALSDESNQELSDAALEEVSGGIDEKGSTETPSMDAEAAKGKGKPGKGLIE